jgi:hypothetical protein
MNIKSQRICVWFAPLFCVVFGIGLILPGYLPPTDPSLGAEAIAALYSENTQMMRLGFILLQAASAMTAPFVAVLSVQMKRIEGQHSPYTYAQLITGGCGVLILLIPTTLWICAAFRPERDPQLIQLLNDLGWLLLTPTFACLCIQVIAIGLAVLSDKHAQPIFPRWFGYLNLWIAVLSLPAGFIAFFRTGPFAWNGVISFWMVAIVFFAWLLITVVLLFKAIDRQAAEESTAS